MERKLWVLALLILVVSMGHTVEAGSRAVTIDDQVFISSGSVGIAIRAMRSGDWDEAREELERVLDRNPRNHYALFDLGVWYERAGERVLAQDYVRKALDIRFSKYYLEGLSRIRGTLGRGSELYRRIFRCRGECGVGNSYARAGLWEEALEHYSESLHYYSRHHVACFHMALAYEALDDRENAIHFCEKAISIKRRNTVKYRNFLEELQSPEIVEPAPWEIQEPEYVEPMDPVEPEFRFVKVDVANLRTSPSTLGRRIQLLHRGSRVEFLKSDSGWVYVRTFHQQEGWIHGELLSITVDGAWENAPTSEVSSDDMFRESELAAEAAEPQKTDTLTIVSQNEDVPVRAEPSILAEIIYYFHPGEEVAILNQSRSKWVFVRTPVGAGYMLTDSFIQE